MHDNYIQMHLHCVIHVHHNSTCAFPSRFHRILECSMAMKYRYVSNHVETCI